ncbi:MAG: hypothetical protein V2A79_14770 [Planctomycetota bacterium]
MSATAKTVITNLIRDGYIVTIQTPGLPPYTDYAIRVIGPNGKEYRARHLNLVEALIAASDQTGD